MTLLMRDQENLEKGEEIGVEKTLILFQRLAEDGRSDEISKIQKDKIYRQKLFEEYNI